MAGFDPAFPVCTSFQAEFGQSYFAFSDLQPSTVCNEALEREKNAVACCVSRTYVNVSLVHLVEFAFCSIFKRVFVDCFAWSGLLQCFCCNPILLNAFREPHAILIDSHFDAIHDQWERIFSVSPVELCSYVMGGDLAKRNVRKQNTFSLSFEAVDSRFSWIFCCCYFFAGIFL